MLSIFRTKKINIPSGQQESITACESWTVQWESRHGSYSNDTRNEYQVFIDEESAEKFAKQLRDAFKLIKHTSGTSVKISKN